MKDSRHFAAELMNRAGITFDAGDVALASSLIEQLEAELGAWRPSQCYDFMSIFDSARAESAMPLKGLWLVVTSKFIG